MKCIKDADGKVRKVTNILARNLVEAGSHEYCPKWEWKDQKGIEYRGVRNGLVEASN